MVHLAIRRWNYFRLFFSDLLFWKWRFIRDADTTTWPPTTGFGPTIDPRNLVDFAGTTHQFLPSSNHVVATWLWSSKPTEASRPEGESEDAEHNNKSYQTFHKFEFSSNKGQRTAESIVSPLMNHNFAVLFRHNSANDELPIFYERHWNEIWSV